MSNPVWDWLIKSKLSAFQATDRLNGPSAMDAGPGWCFDRFGQSSTRLADGSIVFIAGEHEDFYDPDFYIYNDVVVQRPTGRVDVFGYPRDVFPPTDFHSATPVGNRIVIIGNLGYPEQRKPATTPVFVLELGTFAISEVATQGTPPAWIHSHEACLSEDGASIIVQRGLLDRGKPNESFVENLDAWRLDLMNWNWEQLTKRNWQRWEVRRADGERIHLWEFSQALWEKQFPQFKQAAEISTENALPSLEEEIGCVPDLELFERLYNPDVEHETLSKIEGEYGTRRLKIKGTIVRYVEMSHCIQLTIEGDLPEQTVNSLKEDLRERLSNLENSDCNIVQL
jgi:hypothetical protein